MSRTDGNFPPYSKLEYSKQNPPDGWNVGSRRCIGCKKDWPNVADFSPSPCCNYQAGVVADGFPDMDWETAYIELMRFRFERYYEKWNDGATDIELCWNTHESISEQEISEGLEKLNSFISELENETHGKVS